MTTKILDRISWNFFSVFGFIFQDSVIEHLPNGQNKCRCLNMKFSSLSILLVITT